VKEESQDQSLEKSPAKNLTSSDKHSENIMEGSHLTSLHSPAGEDENELSKLVIHYDSLI
jgi:hypothetical protein